MVAHQLTVRSLPGDIAQAECSCGTWTEQQIHPAYWGWAPDKGHKAHVHLAELAHGSAVAHMAACTDVCAKVDATIARMIAAGKLD